MPVARVSVENMRHAHAAKSTFSTLTAWMVVRHDGRMRFAFDAELWRWESRGATWVFATLPQDVSDEIQQVVAGMENGFGSVRVEVVLGGSTWRTSIFPSADAGAYILPVKKAVRGAEGVDIGDGVRFEIELVDF